MVSKLHPSSYPKYLEHNPECCFKNKEFTQTSSPKRPSSSQNPPRLWGASSNPEEQQPDHQLRIVPGERKGDEMGDRELVCSRASQQCGTHKRYLAQMGTGHEKYKLRGSDEFQYKLHCAWSFLKSAYEENPQHQPTFYLNYFGMAGEEGHRIISTGKKIHPAIAVWQEALPNPCYKPLFRIRSVLQ